MDFRVFYWFFFLFPITYQPLMTPSMLSMGMILNTYVSRAFLAVIVFPQRYSITPSITHDELVSPGCTREVKYTMGRSYIVQRTKKKNKKYLITHYLYSIYYLARSNSIFNWFYTGNFENITRKMKI